MPDLRAHVHGMRGFLHNLTGAVSILLMAGLVYACVGFLVGFAASVDRHLSFEPPPTEGPCNYPGVDCWTAPDAPIVPAPPIEWWMLAPAFGALILVVAAITIATSRTDSPRGREAAA